MSEPDYQSLLAAESRKWGDHLRVEASGEWHAWLDHPLISMHYRSRSLVEGLPWEVWAGRRLGQPATRSLDLGCGAGQKSLTVFESGSTAETHGIDISEERIAEAERMRIANKIPGEFRVADVNTASLPPETYDLIFSSHSLHHFVALEHVMSQVHDALTPDGLFILEEFVGPTQFQWTDRQIDLVRTLMEMLPEDLRMLRWGAVKPYEGRPEVKDVVAASPFESIRSSEIVPIFRRVFRVVELRPLGGTLQHLLYNGIVHNFTLDRADARAYVQAIIDVEDALIDSGMLPSDFMLLIGMRRDSLR
ncbi:MAG TPA: class I SAM-dependent methyltransferase [Thermoanaerobaculia bacterium]|nr:class I SAM-dependent methyltransferase [Thermoanaerobaculia bacterium]